MSKTTKGNVPIYETESFSYIKLSDVPKEYIDEFGKWLYGQTCPMADGELCVYSWDWDRWYDLKTKGIPTYFD